MPGSKLNIENCERFVTLCNKMFFLSKFDNQVSKQLLLYGIHTRPVKSHGLWCSVLVPVILLIYSMQNEVSLLYTVTMITSSGLLAYCLLFSMFLSVSNLHQDEYASVFCSLMSFIFIYTFVGTGITTSIVLGFLPIMLFSKLLRYILIACPRTFTVGEAIVVIQSVILFCTMAAASVVFYKSVEGDFVDVVIYTVLSTVGLLVTALYLLPNDMRTIKILFCIVSAGATLILTAWHSILGPYCILTMIEFVFFDQFRMKIFFFWLFLTVVAVCVILTRTRVATKADTVTRKSFHILASAVFSIGILSDLDLMKLAAGVALGVLLFVEGLRKANIEPISSALQSAFQVYADEKDCGTLAMTPIYLFTGLAGPIVLVPASCGCTLDLLSGVLAIGIGDTAASWFGARYGQNKWPGGTRTIEGTIFNILSQIAAVYALDLFDLLSVKNALPRAAIVAIVSGLIESQTEQVDNLILPLVTIIMFQITSIMF